MRTYSHALLSWAAVRRAAGRGLVGPAVLGAVVPDVPIALGAAWLFLRRGAGFGRGEIESEVCARTVFRGPDAALHSALPVGLALVLRAAAGRARGSDGALFAFLLGWAGHVFADTLTHAQDARPAFWPFPGWRFRGPISYWDRSHHALTFSVAEHAAMLLAVAGALRHGTGERRSRHGWGWGSSTEALRIGAGRAVRWRLNTL